MSQNEEGMLGTRPRLTPQEVGMIVRIYRESNQVKRAALAAQANVSEKTLERLEAGMPVQETTYRRVATDPRQILTVFGAHSCLADDHKVAADDLELIAAFKENFRDWSDISSDLAETARLDAARQLLEQAQEIERAGYAVCIGLTNRYGINGVRTDLVVIVFIPLGQQPRATLPTEIWLSKTMKVGW